MVPLHLQFLSYCCQYIRVSSVSESATSLPWTKQFLCICWRLWPVKSVGILSERHSAAQTLLIRLGYHYLLSYEWAGSVSYKELVIFVTNTWVILNSQGTFESGLELGFLIILTTIVWITKQLVFYLLFLLCSEAKVVLRWVLCVHQLAKNYVQQIPEGKQEAK